VDVEEADHPHRFGPAAVGLDHQHDLGGVGEHRLEERRRLVPDVLVGVQEFAADHPLQEGVVDPGRKVLEVRGSERAEIDARAA
jgi:hypothetical protein